MKRFVCMILVTILLLSSISLCACEPEVWGYRTEELLNNVVKVELVHFPEIENPIRHKRKLENVKSINFNDATLVEELDPTLYPDFFKKLCEVPFGKDFYYSVDYPIGYTLLMHQKNGDIILISTYESTSDGCYGMHAKFDENGNFIEQYNSFHTVIIYYRVILQFFDINIGIPPSRI